MDGRTDTGRPNQNGEAALHLAAAAGNLETVQQLCEVKDSDLNERNNRQQTPLHLAAANGHAGVVRKLIAAGADPHVVDSYGLTPWDYATHNRHFDVLREALQSNTLDLYHLL